MCLITRRMFRRGLLFGKREIIVGAFNRGSRQVFSAGVGVFFFLIRERKVYVGVYTKIAL